MGQPTSNSRYWQSLPYLGLLVAVLIAADAARCDTLGLKDPQGNFVPKVVVTLGNKEVLIKKVQPQEPFRSFALTLNPKNKKLISGVASLSVEWLGVANRPGKPVPFAGPRYDPGTRVFQEPMTQSASLKIIDKSARNLLGVKTSSELFTISVDGELLISSEAAEERDRTVQLGSGRDVSINVDVTSILFNEGNLKKGEWINVENRSGLDQTLGVEVPERGLAFKGIVRKTDQAKIPRENWDRIAVPANSGISIALVPDPDPAKLEPLHGKDITIKVYQGNKVRETRVIPIRVGSDLRLGATPDSGPGAIPGDEKPGPTKGGPSPISQGPPRVETRSPQAKQPPPTDGPGRAGQGVGLWLWALQVANLVLLVALGVFSLLFMFPKIQVLEDRIVKSEMFLHGSREAIREELDQVKREILDRGPQENIPE